MKIRCAASPEKGITIAEVVISLAILAVMAAGIMGSFSYGFLTVQLVRENQRATQIMLERAETIRLYNWDQVNSNGFIPSVSYVPYDPQAPTNSQGIMYRCDLEVTNFPFSTSYATNLRRFVIKLQWTGAGGITRTRSLTTLVAKDGMQNYVY